MFRQYSRPFDPSGSSLQNLIIAEKRPIVELQEYIFIPSHGCFYTESLVVSNGSETLKVNEDYRCILLNKEATLETGKEVAILIQILRTDLQEVFITYQAVGGKYQNLSKTLLSLKDAIGTNMVSPIRWGDIVGKPNGFAAAPHYHPYWEFDEWTEVVKAIKKIELSILYKKQDKYKAMLEYADESFRELRQLLKLYTDTISKAYNESIRNLSPPVGYVVFSTKDINDSVIDYRMYPETGDTLIYSVINNTDILKKFQVSEDIVPPYPDNVLLAENDFFILRNDENFIFLDNEKENAFNVTDYAEEVDEQFDATFVRAYIVQNRKLYPRATINIDQDLTVNKTAKLSIEVEGYDPALGTISYYISGIHSEHLNIPLTGALILDADGRFEKEINLIDTNKNQLSRFLNIRIAGAVEENVYTTEYRAGGALTKPVKIRAINPVDPLNNSPTFYFDSVIRLRYQIGEVDVNNNGELSYHGFSNLSTENPTVESITINPNTEYLRTIDLKDVKQVANGSYADTVKVKASLFDGKETHNFELLVKPVEVSLKLVDAVSLAELTSVKPNQKFKFLITQKRGSVGVIYSLTTTMNSVSNGLNSEMEKIILMGTSNEYLSKDYFSTATGELTMVLNSSIDNEKPIVLKIPFE